MKYIRISLFFFLLPVFLYSQQVDIATSADRKEIKIGEEIRYKITVQTEANAQVFFPTPEQFVPFEVIRENKIDTLREHDKVRFIKEYGLTQFDTGHYVLRPLRIDVNNREYKTDSLLLAVRNVVIDTLKQPLYPVKSAIEIEKVKDKSSSWLLWIGILLFLGIVAGGYWFFFKRKRQKIENPEAILPPFDRALLKLKNLQNSRYLIESNHKEYYSVLTDIIRKYLEEEIHISATESTTDELLAKLQVFLDAGKLHLSPEVLEELKTVLHKADLVKFAKSKPEDFEAENDRKAIETIVVKTNEGLPDIVETEEENEQDTYQRKRMEALQKKKRNRYIAIIAAAGLLLSLMVWGTWYAFTMGQREYINMENWITSAYGYPPVTLSTPHVLKREKNSTDQVRFLYKQAKDPLSIMLISTNLKEYIGDAAANAEETQGENALNELVLKMIEMELIRYFQGENIMIKDDPYTTVQGIAGHKVFGSFTRRAKEPEPMRYQSFFFIQGENLHMLLFAYPEKERAMSASLVEKIMTTIHM